MRLILFTTAILFPLFAICQKYDQTWAFGTYQNVSLKFPGADYEKDSLHSDIFYFFTSASISDTAGNLLFYTNGRMVMNRNGDTMKNGDYLSPQLRAFDDWYYGFDIGFQNLQGTIALPKPGSDSLYYLFAVDYDSLLWQVGGIARPYYLTLNIIDMSADSGLGEVTEKNKHLFADTMSSAGMTACKHANGRDWWLIRNEYHTNCYYIWLITPDTIYPPSKQCIGYPIDVNDGNSGFEFSPDGRYFAHQIAKTLYKISMEFMEFDRCSGQLSNPVLIDVPDSLAKGVFTSTEFSPDGRFLYGFMTQIIYQADLEDINIAGSLTKVGEWIYSDSIYGYFGGNPQLASDGKIYIQGLFGNPALSVINEPNEKGTLANLTLQNFELPTLCACGIPNMPNYQLGALAGSPCDTLTGIQQWQQYNSITSVRVIPNPNDGRFAVSYQLPQNKEGMLTITNQLGAVVYTERRPQWSSICSINLPQLAKGIYLVSLESNGKRKSAKFAKQ
ncbi:MAG: T9SS type A sorting domain-containing protein [Bacteroidetes bacterium]|nr:T9SS type A sorting domain-containing protein [Bacteroidota bacterium]